MNKKSVGVILLYLLLATCSGQPEPETAATAVSVTAPASEPTPALTAEIPAPTANLTDGCVESYQAGVDYFPEKAEVTHSNGFTIEYFPHYKVVTVHSPFPGAAEVATYVLVQCGTAVPEGYEEAVTVEVPLNSLVAMSTTYLPHLPTLDAVDKLVGLDNLAFVNTPEIRARIDAGQVAEVGFGAEVNVEQVLDLDPDIVMTYSSGSADFDAQPKLEEAGVTVVVNSDYLDSNPLGQAEWVKFLAAFLNQEAAATTWFADVAAEYNELAEQAAAAETQPTVFLGTPYEGTWYMAGGQSYVAQLLADAGADYVWGDDPSDTTLYLDFETVFDQAQDAEYWINLGFVSSLADLAAADERFAEFAAYQSGTVYNNDARLNEAGGNDYYEGGAANPHLVLADLIKIFHPELLPAHEFVYYRLVE